MGLAPWVDTGEERVEPELELSVEVAGETDDARDLREVVGEVGGQRAAERENRLEVGRVAGAAAVETEARELDRRVTVGVSEDGAKRLGSAALVVPGRLEYLELRCEQAQARGR